MKKFARYLFTGLGLFFFSLSLYAQRAPAGKVSVQVADEQGKPLPFVSVLLRRMPDSSLVKGELSTEQGRAAFDKIAAGQYFVQASLLGYTTKQSETFTIDAAHTDISLKQLQLPPAPRNLQAVNVTAQRPFIERTGGKTVLNVESSVTSAGNTALDLLRKAPGVTIDQNDNILIKGSQGATVMIDGKLTYLSGEQLANLLKSLQAENISQIEIITTPSAKYDAAGNGGIINIKTKKGQLTGMNGSVNAGIGGGMYPVYNAGLNLNWRTPKFNLFGNYNHGDRFFGTNRELHRRIMTDEPMLFRQYVFQRNQFINNNYKAGLDYFINSKHTVGVMVTGYANAFKNNMWSHTDIGNPAGSVDSVLNTLTTNNNRFRNMAVNLNYKGALDTSGTEITVDVDLARFRNRRALNLGDSIYDAKLEQYRNANAIRNNGRTNITIKSVKADLTLPLTKQSKLEAGVKASFVETDNQLQYDSLQNGVYVPSLSQSDRFVYKENILAAYASYKLQWKKTDIQVGLRMEKTISEGNSFTVKSQVKRSYLDLFPSASADYKFNEDHKLGLSYSKRIERPGYGGLNPFLFFLDKYTYGQGNPYLRPEYTHTAELSYTFKQKYIITAGYSHTNDVIQEYLLQDDSTKITTSTVRNLNKQNNYNLNLTLPFDFTKWWNSNNTASLYYTEYLLKNQEVNLDMQNDIFGYYFNTTNTFTLPKNFKLEISGYYYSPFVEGIFRGKAQYDANAGLQKSLMDKKLVLKFNVNNIIGRGPQFFGTARYNNVDMYIHNIWQVRNYNFAITYNFGNAQIKGARERQTGSSDELKRAGN